MRVEAIYSPFDKGGRGDFKNRNPSQEIPQIPLPPLRKGGCPLQKGEAHLLTYPWRFRFIS